MAPPPRQDLQQRRHQPPPFSLLVPRDSVSPKKEGGVTSDLEGREGEGVGQSLAESLTSHSTGTESDKRGRQKHPPGATWQVQGSRAQLGREA